MNIREKTTEKPLAVEIPRRGREMRTTRIPKASSETMRLRLLDNMTNGKIDKTNNKFDIVDEYLKYKALSKKDSKDIYHQVCKQNKLYLIPDKTLDEMETIVNFRIGKKRITRYGNPKIEEPSLKDECMYKLDSIIEKLDDMVSSSESSSYSESYDESNVNENAWKGYKSLPFHYLLCQLDNLTKKLNDIKFPLLSTSNITVQNPNIPDTFKESQSKGERETISVSRSPFSMRSEAVKTFYSFHTMASDTKSVWKENVTETGKDIQDSINTAKFKDRQTKEGTEKISASISPFSIRSNAVKTFSSFHTIASDKKSVWKENETETGNVIQDELPSEKEFKTNLQNTTSPTIELTKIDKNSLSKPIKISHVLRKKPVKFRIVGNYENCEPIFQIRKCESEREIPKRSKALDEDSKFQNKLYKTEGKRLKISISGKLLHKDRLQWENDLFKETKFINPDSQGDSKAFSFQRSISKDDLNQILISISGQYVKKDNETQYCPSVSLKINHQNGTVEQIYKKSFTCKYNQFENGKIDEQKKPKVYFTGEKPATDDKVYDDKDLLVNIVTSSSIDTEDAPDESCLRSKLKLNVSKLGTSEKALLSHLQKTYSTLTEREGLLDSTESVENKVPESNYNKLNDEQNTNITKVKSIVLERKPETHDMKVYISKSQNKLGPFIGTGIKDKLPDEIQILDSAKAGLLFETKCNTNKGVQSDILEDTLLLNTKQMRQEIDKYDIKPVDKIIPFIITDKINELPEEIQILDRDKTSLVSDTMFINPEVVKSDILEASMLPNKKSMSQEKYDITSPDKISHTEEPQATATVLDKIEPDVSGIRTSTKIGILKRMHYFANNLAEKLKSVKSYIKHNNLTTENVKKKETENKTSKTKRVKKKKRKVNICENPILGQFEEFFME